MLPGSEVAGADGSARLPPSGLEVVEAWWERIQLVVRLRRGPGSTVAVDEGDIVLSSPTVAAGPLRSRPAGEPAPDERLVRFNVFADDDQIPLDAGRWNVLVHRSGSEEEWAAVPAHPDRFITPTELREFVSGSSMYRVKLTRIDGERPLAVEISTWKRAGRRRSLWSAAPLRAWWRELRRRAWVRLFHSLVAALRRVPRRGRVIVFTSDSRADIGGNLKLVHDRMLDRRLDRDFQIRTIFKPGIRMRRSARDRARLVWLLARAEVILLEDYQPAIHRLQPRPDQRIIQLWHAWGAFKTVGYSRIGKPGGVSPYSQVHKNYTYATVSSTHEVPFYAEAFGIPEERVVPTGTPRMDDFLDPDRQAERRGRALDAIPSADGREVMLFAPTFRGASARRAHYPIDLVDLPSLHRVTEERDAIFLIRMHPFVRRRLDIPDPYRDRIVDAGDLAVETNDLLLISNLLITDYSSIIFEYAALGRPMLFFAYDQQEYVASRDFYEPYETFVPGRIVHTFEDLLRAIRERDYEQEKVGPFARRHLPSEPGSATDRIIDQLIIGG